MLSGLYRYRPAALAGPFSAALRKTSGQLVRIHLSLRLRVFQREPRRATFASNLQGRLGQRGAHSSMPEHRLERNRLCMLDNAVLLFWDGLHFSHEATHEKKNADGVFHFIEAFAELCSSEIGQSYKTRTRGSKTKPKAISLMVARTLPATPWPGALLFGQAKPRSVCICCTAALPTRQRTLGRFVRRLLHSFLSAPSRSASRSHAKRVTSTRPPRQGFAEKPLQEKSCCRHGCTRPKSGCVTPVAVAPLCPCGPGLGGPVDVGVHGGCWSVELSPEPDDASTKLAPITQHGSAIPALPVFAKQPLPAGETPASTRCGLVLWAMVKCRLLPWLAGQRNASCGEYPRHQRTLVQEVPPHTVLQGVHAAAWYGADSVGRDDLHVIRVDSAWLTAFEVCISGRCSLCIRTTAASPDCCNGFEAKRNISGFVVASRGGERKVGREHVRTVPQVILLKPRTCRIYNLGEANCD